MTEPVKRISPFLAQYTGMSPDTPKADVEGMHMERGLVTKSYLMQKKLLNVRLIGVIIGLLIGLILGILVFGNTIASNIVSPFIGMFIGGGIGHIIMKKYS